MIKTANLTNKIKNQLPAELVDFTQLAGGAARRLEQNLYLVGGVVRDLLLGRENLDLDLVVEGNAIQLAEELARLKKGKVIAHSRFNTAKIRWDKWSVDIASARGETYDRPGALPTVQPSDLRSDLIRRDFTINAMAVCLAPLRYGELIDLYKGQEDLERRYVRILHDNSFKDDATRIWRAVRYEQRLDFRIEPHTLDLLKRDISYLDTISGDRIRHELELCLEEEKPEKVLLRAGELGILSRINPALKTDEALFHKMAKARGRLEPYSPPRELYLAFLAYRLNPEELKQVIAYLKLPKAAAHALQDTIQLKSELPSLNSPGIEPSRVYHCLHRYSQTAILANLMTIDSRPICQHIETYLESMRHVQPILTGDDLVRMGIPSGPQIKEALEVLREARLDGKVKTRRDEENLIEKKITLSS